MKYSITEEQLANIIEESTKKILSEAIENEGLGSSIMKGIGSAAGKAMQHVSNWGDSFRQGYNQYYNGGGGYGQNAQGGQEQNQILQRLSTEIENMKQQISALEQGNPQQPQPQQPQPAQPNQNKRKRK